MINIVWFRNDLRITDNPALTAALKEGGKVQAIYIRCPKQWQQHGWGKNKIDFIEQCLFSLEKQLSTIKVPLKILECTTFKQVPKLLLEFCQTQKDTAVYYNREYELNEVRRDEATTDFLSKNKLELHAFDDQCLVPPGSVYNLQNKPYTVFTPFKKACYKILAPQKFKLTNPHNGDPQKMLADFCEERLSLYKQQRDFPAIDGTSRLSAYLAVGAISVRECYLTAQKIAPNTGLTWMDELLWRDFYRHIVWHFPDVCRGYNFNRKYDKLKWNPPGDNLKRWQAGETGIPIIDAAMRQLTTTGWMHNRLRMIVAMFLSKNLFIDWRYGEEFFAEHLVDIDFASNNGGWQWSASTGTDAAPYFRIFNPLSQSEKFDPKGVFIKKYCSELKNIAAQKLHNPDPANIIVDLKTSRATAIEAFKNL